MPGPLSLLREDWEHSGGREAPGLLGHTGDPEAITVCTMEFPAGRGSWESADVTCREMWFVADCRAGVPGEPSSKPLPPCGPGGPAQLSQALLCLGLGTSRVWVQTGQNGVPRVEVEWNPQTWTQPRDLIEAWGAGSFWTWGPLGGCHVY